MLAKVEASMLSAKFVYLLSKYTGNRKLTKGHVQNWPPSNNSERQIFLHTCLEETFGLTSESTKDLY